MNSLRENFRQLLVFIHALVSGPVGLVVTCQVGLDCGKPVTVVTAKATGNLK